MGIGTTAPRTNLDVGDGFVAATRLTLTQDTTTTSASWQVDNSAGLFRIFWQPNIYANGTVVLYATTSGNVGIGEASPQYPLSVNGTIQAREVLVNTNFADYVFGPGYRVRPLTETAEYIKANHHLPDIPSAAEVKEKGLSVGDMESKLLAKIEELTLQMIELNKQNERMQKRVAELEKR